VTEEGYGAIRRSQTLLNCTVGDIEKPYQWVVQQAETYEKLIEKLKKEQKKFQQKARILEKDVRTFLHNEIAIIFQDAINAIPAFAEDHWNSSEGTLKFRWEEKLKYIRFEERINTAYQEAVETLFNKEIQEAIEEVGRELQLIAGLGGGTGFGTGFGFNEQDSEDFWRHAFRIGGSLLGLVGAGFLLFANPIGWAFVIVGGIAGILSGFFKSKAEKRREAVDNISSLLKSQLDNQKKNTLLNAEEQFGKHCQLVSTNIDTYFNNLIAGLERNAQHLNYTENQFEIILDNLNRAYAKRLIDWCCHKYEPLTQDCIDAVISKVRRDSIGGINITSKIPLDLKVDAAQIETVIQQSVTFEQPQTSSVKTPYKTGELIMTNLFEAIINFFEKDEWYFQVVESGKSLKMSMELENGTYTCYAIVDDESNSFRFYSISPVNIPKNQYLPIAEFLARANYGLILGNFEMDFKDGEIRYKTSIIVDQELSYSIISKLVYTNLSTMDDYFPGFMRIIYGGISPEEALNQIEKEEE